MGQAATQGRPSRTILPRFVLSAALLAALAFPVFAATSTWQIDPAHTAAGFAVKHLMISTVRGQFKGVNGTVVWDDQDVSKSTIDVTIDARTIDTSEPKRDEDLRSDKFFDTAKYPAITFKSKKIENVSAGKLKVTGDLTIRGTTRSVVLTADPIGTESKDMYGLIRVGTSATTKISRKDYGLVWNAILETGGVALGDEVKITLDVQFIRKS